MEMDKDSRAVQVSQLNLMVRGEDGDGRTKRVPEEHEWMRRIIERDARKEVCRYGWTETEGKTTMEAPVNTSKHHVLSLRGTRKSRTAITSPCRVTSPVRRAHPQSSSRIGSFSSTRIATT